MFEPDHIMCLLATKPVFRVCPVTETNYIIDILYTASLANIVSLKANEDADQTVCMHRLVCTFIIHMQQNQVFSG